MVILLLAYIYIYIYNNAEEENGKIILVINYIVLSGTVLCLAMVCFTS